MALKVTLFENLVSEMSHPTFPIFALNDSSCISYNPRFNDSDLWSYRIAVIPYSAILFIPGISPPSTGNPQAMACIIAVQIASSELALI